MKFNTLFLLLFLGFHLSFAQKTSKQINDFLETYHQYGKLNGAVLVADSKEILLKKGFGMADFDWQIPIRQ
jgi:hypothetical protein